MAHRNRGLPIKNGWIFHGYVSHNQIVDPPVVFLRFFPSIYHKHWFSIWLVGNFPILITIDRKHQAVAAGTDARAQQAWGVHVLHPVRQPRRDEQLSW